ncbi:YjdF family protein [Cohnella thermotolerans]|uniref:YjdF family protein n=1 Tax=Cohnella thermotolerans TaxID=329858 RepID=UPI0004069998|nr:YjdF family protein [Cohnella thermotolerans]
MRLTVYFDGQFWVGVAEQSDGSKVKACRHLFGAEPQDGEVMAFVQHRLLPLLESVQTSAEGDKPPQAKRVNPKRLARQVAREMDRTGVSSLAQEALKLELEARKKERAHLDRKRQDELREARWQRKVQKAKEKRRGR